MLLMRRSKRVNGYCILFYYPSSFYNFNIKVNSVIIVEKCSIMTHYVKEIVFCN